jgi:predicted GTPase
MLSRWRLGVVAFLISCPLAVLMAAGAYYLWEQPWSRWLWWGLLLPIAAGYLLAWYWQRQGTLVRVPWQKPKHWGEQDRRAWELVDQQVRELAQVAPEKLVQPDFYWEQAATLAQRLATVYRPGAKDPIGRLTIGEILAIIELVAHDMSRVLDEYLPAADLLTIDDWKRLPQLVKFYRRAQNVLWLVRAFVSPLDTALRYVASRVGIAVPASALQRNLLVWLTSLYVQQVGKYLIELYSGRLRVGADRYRSLLEGAPHAEVPKPGPWEELASREGHLRLVVVGQVKAGKSSLINALLGAHRAETSVLPITREVTEYTVHLPGAPQNVIFLDTVGYGQEGPSSQTLDQTYQVAAESHLVLLVLRATNAARGPDLAFLRELRRRFTERPDVPMPPVVAVITHVDLLPPSLEWQPPYDWHNPSRSKEHSIAGVVAHVHEQFGDGVTGVIPVCTAPDRLYGVAEWLLPALLQHLDDARGVLLARLLRTVAQRRRPIVLTLWRQTQIAARQAWAFLASRRRGS